MSLRERCRIELVVQRLGWWFDWNRMRGRHRRAALREVRANLRDAAVAGDLGAAIERLGPARVLAEAYVEGEPAGIRWRAGWFAALAAHTLVLWLAFAAAISFAEGVQAVGPETSAVYETDHSLTLGEGPLLSFEQTERGFTFHLPFLGWPHLAAVVAAFLAFSRPWRAAPSRRQAARG